MEHQATPPDRHAFGVAIMCALPLEATAVAALFELKWDASALDKERNDPNAYSVSAIGRHNVVLVHMPRMGKVPSASVAAHLNRSFPNLKLVLMVGICGGVPLSSASRRYLGDVVISEGIVQRSKRRPFWNKILQNIFGIYKGRLEGSAEYPGLEWDKVYRPDYLHRHREEAPPCGICSGDRVCDDSVKMGCIELECSDEGLEERPECTVRSRPDKPIVHFGLIASGDTVVRSGKFRDEIVNQTDVIAFEMEGAGMCMEFPSFLVIKGICDYADSHKNKTFQHYSAGTAAATAKELLRHWIPYTPLLSHQARAHESPSGHFQQSRLSAEDYKLLRYLETTPYRERKDRNPLRIQGTCQWFLCHRTFQSWTEGHDKILWVSADPGCGKSVLARYLVDDVLPTAASRTTCYFFFKPDFEDQRNATTAISCLLHQLFKQRPVLFSEQARGMLQAERERLLESFSKLWDTLIEAVGHPSAGDILCLMDALDECEEGSRSQFTRELGHLYCSGKLPNLRFLLTSRPFGSIHRGFQLPDGIGLSVVHLTGENEEEATEISEEIDIFIKARVPSICARLRLAQHEQEYMLQELLRTPHRTYLWVYLTLQHIKGNIHIDKGGIMKAISELPRSVDEAYERILSLSTDPSKARKILQLIVAAARPLEVQEINLALEIKSDSEFYRSVRMVQEDRFRHMKKKRREEVKKLFQRASDIVVPVGLRAGREAREFLIDNDIDRKAETGSKRGWEWKNTVDLAASNYLLASICIWHLTFMEVNTFGQRELWLVSKSSQPDVARRNLEAKFTASGNRRLFLTYSAVNFARHVRESMKHLCRSVEDSCPLTKLSSSRLAEIHGVWIWSDFYLTTEPILTSLTSTVFTALTAAVDSGQIETVKFVLDREPNLSAGQTTHLPLYIALRNHDQVMFQLLIDRGASIRATDMRGDTAMTLAVAAQLKDLVETLIAMDSDILNVSTPVAPLWLACRAGNEPIVELLLKAGAWTTTLEARFDGCTPLLAAVESGACGVVEALLHYEADIEAETRDESQTPLLLATNKNNVGIMRLLLGHGANINAQDEHGQTAFGLACNHCFSVFKSSAQLPLLDVVRVLKNHGARLQKPTLLSGSHELFTWIAVGGDPPSVRDSVPFNWSLLERFYTLKYGAMLYTRSWFEENNCSSEFLIKGMELLLKYEETQNYVFKDDEGRTILSQHCRCLDHSDFSMVKLLLEHRIPIEDRCDKGKTALAYAVTKETNLTLVEELLRNRADVNERHNNGRSVLSWAAARSSAPIVDLLLRSGVKVHATDNDGRSVLSWATSRYPENQDVIRLLRSHGAKMVLGYSPGVFSRPGAAELDSTPLTELKGYEKAEESEYAPRSPVLGLYGGHLLKDQ
ncbi:ankyrin repeat domain-containing protein 50 [Podospora fimiseda]|uniref:Ankyrin repeat domain-containing protein 50 n=1 Tax=Podospora fimiseda TaxID=252190 RepID=A0AAN7BM12_9PEZI|nr:ankyrin repeat domain-containing protein 50 [Podospora fimiseda]